MSARVECPWCERLVKLTPDSPTVLVNHMTAGNRQQTKCHCPASGRALSQEYIAKVGLQ